MILVALFMVPFLGGGAAWVVGRYSQLWPRFISLAVLVADIGLMPRLLHGLAPHVAGQTGRWLLLFSMPWIPAFGIGIHLGVDGLSWLLTALTLAIGIFCVVVSWHEIEENTGFFHANLLWAIAGAVGVFIALDLFLFFFFWELMLVPMYLIIAIWGHEGRREAALKFFLFTQGSGLLMLVAILTLVFLNRAHSGQMIFDYFALATVQPVGVVGFFIMFGFAAAFVVKLAVFPLHSWLPVTHTQAPTAGSVLLASILLKTGGYGLMRFVVPLFAQISHEVAPYALWLGVVSVSYGAILAFGQTDLKRLIAYSSISHMGFVLIGIFSFNPIAWQGVVVLMIAHGISTGALFIIVGSLQHRLHTRELGRMGGLWSDLPRLSSLGTLFVLASMGLPGFGNFVGEFLVLRGAYSASPMVAAAAAVGLVPAALYSLLAIQKAFHGTAQQPRCVVDSGGRELSMLLVLAVGIIWLGVLPQPVLKIAAPGLANLGRGFSQDQFIVAEDR